MQHISAVILDTIDAAQDLVEALEYFSDHATGDADTKATVAEWCSVISDQRDQVRAKLQLLLDNSTRECPR